MEPLQLPQWVRHFPPRHPPTGQGGRAVHPVADPLCLASYQYLLSPRHCTGMRLLPVLHLYVWNRVSRRPQRVTPAPPAGRPPGVRTRAAS
jgi:hypothetical protein